MTEGGDSVSTTTILDVIETVNQDSGYLSGNNSDFLTLSTKIIGFIFIISFFYAITLICWKPPEDYFVKRALIYLILALLTRIMMSTSLTISGTHEALENLDDPSSSAMQTTTWQQFYWEVPFYLFMIVPMSMLFSWKLAYLNCMAFVNRSSDDDTEALVNISGAESLDGGDGERRPRLAGNTEPLLSQKPEADDPFDVLSGQFRKLVTLIVVALFLNSASTLVHTTNPAAINSQEGSPLYKTGQVSFFSFFIILLGIQIYVFIDGFVVFAKWRKLIIPSEDARKKAEQDDSEKNEAQLRLETIRALMKENTFKMNIIFLYLEVQASVRLAIYFYVRFRTLKAFIDWIYISDKLFFAVYFTEIWITFGLFIFLFFER